jgi:hypothetical protein
MTLSLTYLGTATLDLRIDGTRLLTDPVFDPRGTRYDFGYWYTPRAWFSSEKRYDPPVSADALGAVDAVLLSHREPIRRHAVRDALRGQGCARAQRASGSSGRGRPGMSSRAAPVNSVLSALAAIQW